MLAGMAMVKVAGAEKSPACDSSTSVVAGSSAGRRTAESPGAPTVTVTWVGTAGGVVPASKAAETVVLTADEPSDP